MQIEARNVTRLFGQTKAVDSASFVIDRPMMVGIIGSSGAGKSTLLRMVNRLTDASSGQLVVDGTDVLALKGAAMRAWQSRCAMVFQQFNLVPRIDVVSNVLHGLLNRRGTMTAMFNLWSRDDITRAIAILDRLGIAEQAAKRAERQVVLLDRGEGRFEPKEVKVGVRGEGYTEIRDGVAAGDRVVTAANFLIDAESNLKAALQSLAAPKDVKDDRQAANAGGTP